MQLRPTDKWASECARSSNRHATQSITLRMHPFDALRSSVREHPNKGLSQAVKTTNLFGGAVAAVCAPRAVPLAVVVLPWTDGVVRQRAVVVRGVQPDRVAPLSQIRIVSASNLSLWLDRVVGQGGWTEWLDRAVGVRFKFSCERYCGW
jgi:hypothetical protein